MQATAIEAILGLSGRLAWLSLLHATWLGLFAAAAVAIAFQAGPRLSHRARHDTSLVALVVVALGAPAIGIAQHVAGPSWGNEPEEAAASVAIAQGAGETDQPRPAAPANVSNTEAPSQPFLRGAMSALLRSAVAATSRSRTVVMAAWSFGFLGLACVLAIATTAARRLRRASIPAESFVQARATRLCRLLRLGRAPEIRVHATLAEPCLCGVIRPIVLLPGGWLAKAGPEAIDAVLAHELAHARRADHLVNVLQRLIETWLFFHPAVHWLSRSLRRHREFCTDALSVRLTGNPLALARAMESVALLRRPHPMIRPLGASLGCEASSLYPRIQELIGMTPPRPRKRFWPFAVLPLAASLAVLLFSVGAARDRPDPSSLHVEQITTDVDAGGPFPYTTKQVNLGVHFYDIDVSAWRDFHNGLQPAGEGRGSEAWIVEGVYRAHNLITFLEQRNVSRLQCPTVTTFDGDYALFITQGRADQVDRVKLTGTLTPSGMKLTIDLCSQLCPLTAREQTRDPAADSKAIHAAVMTEDFANRAKASYRSTREIPAGSSVLICLGDVIPEAGSGTPPCKRLVMLTPQRIDLDDPQDRP